MFFILLQVIALRYYVTYMSFPKSIVLSGVSDVQGKVMEVRNELNKQLNLNSTNIRLQYENVALKEKTKQSFIQLGNGKVQINDTLYRQQYVYIPALVINSTTDRANNFFTINAGRVQGIHEGLGVISDRGVIGVVHKVSDHYSLIKSVLTENINIDIMVESNGAFGLLKWDGKSHRKGTLLGISNDMKLKKWQKIVTRGGSGLFPRNIPVGKICKIESIEGKPLWNVSVLFSENYRSTQRVYIIKNLMLQEQKKIEALIPVDKDNDGNTKAPK
jgi:rod shape-determining protein MreC